METLEYDPKTKQQIKDALHAFLYAPVTRQFKASIESLIARNTAIGGYTHQHFIYKGIVYNAEPTQPPMKKNRLVAQLRGPMDQYLADVQAINEHEMPFVLGFINQVLNSSNSLTDYIAVMPESIHAPLEALRATCPCRYSCLSQDKVEALKVSNHNSINLIKQRLVLNLLI